MKRSVPHRSDIPARYTWGSTALFASPRAWEAELSAVLAQASAVGARAGTLSRGPSELAEGLRRVEELSARMMRVMVYAGFSYAVDTTNARAAGMNDRAQAAFGRVSAAVSFVDPELLRIGRTTLEAWMAADDRLSGYRHYVDNLFRRQAHVRSAEVEELMGMLADPFSGPSTISSMLVNADLKFPPARGRAGSTLAVSQGTIGALLENADRTVRQSAWNSYMRAHAEHRSTLAATLGASIKQNVLKSRARRFDSTLEAALFGDALSVEVFHNALRVFRRRLPVWHRYFDIRRRALKLRKLAHFDMWAPLGKAPAAIGYEQAVDMICEGLAPLGKEYVARVRFGCLRERWVDVLPNQGKREGAFSWGSFGTLPYIMMSFTGDVTSVSTLAHELGHSMHSLLTWKTQPYAYSSYSTFVAEVASNLHQALVRAHLLRGKSGRAMRRAVIEEAMANFFRYLFIMPTLARFELETHQRAERGEALTADLLQDLMTGLMEEGYGKAVAVDREREGMLWASFPHLFEDYYTFQYETGIAGAHAIATRILQGKDGAAEAYCRFLSLGSSEYPLDALKVAGVDLATPRPVEQAFDVLDGYVTELEELV